MHMLPMFLTVQTNLLTETIVCVAAHIGEQTGILFLCRRRMPGCEPWVVCGRLLFHHISTCYQRKRILSSVMISVRTRRKAWESPNVQLPVTARNNLLIVFPALQFDRSFLAPNILHVFYNLSILSLQY
jgi:hypothetical protein